LPRTALQSADQFTGVGTGSTSANAFARIVVTQHGFRILSDVFSGVSHCLVIRIFT
jgi:hypothetical protein